jgi:hypothetical protein
MMRLLAITIAAGLALTGCASTQAGPGGGGSSGGSSSTSAAASGAPGPVSPSSAVPSVQPSGSAGNPISVRCPTSLDLGQYNGPDTRALPAGFTVSWVLRCSIVPLVGSHREVVTERSDSDPSQLLQALGATSEPGSKGVCPLLRMMIPYFALVQPNGEAVAPKMPLTGCGLPQAAVVQALNDLQFKVLSRRPLP